eukprot:12424808-Alexandrium_andersonii.AAC.1
MTLGLRNRFALVRKVKAAFAIAQNSRQPGARTPPEGCARRGTNSVGHGGAQTAGAEAEPGAARLGTGVG